MDTKAILRSPAPGPCDVCDGGYGCFVCCPQLRVVNLTPHAVVLRCDERDYTFPAAGVPARVSTTARPVDTTEAGPWPVVVTSFGDVTGLPESPTKGALYLVSRIVRDAIASRNECGWPVECFAPQFVCPDTGPESAIRDAWSGRIIAVRRFTY